MKHVLFLSYLVAAWTGIAAMVLAVFVYARRKTELIKRLLIVLVPLAVPAVAASVRSYLSIVAPSATYPEWLLLDVNIVSFILVSTAVPFFTHRLSGHKPPTPVLVCLAVLASASLVLVLAKGTDTAFLNFHYYRVNGILLMASIVYSVAVFFRKTAASGNVLLRRMLSSLRFIFILTVPLYVVIFVMYEYLVAHTLFLEAFYYLFFNFHLIIVLDRYFVAGTDSLFMHDTAREDHVKEVTDRHGLSKTEAGILALIGRGLGNKQIAAEIGITEGTVKNSVTVIFRKTGLSRRMDLVKLAAASNDRPAGDG